MSEEGTSNGEHDMMNLASDKYQEAIDILTSQGKFHINLGLKRVQQFLDLIGNPHKQLKFIHVAGTNGKGSVCAMLSSILEEERENKKLESETKLFSAPCSLFPSVGLFTSPHIFEYTERIKINGKDIPKEVFAEKVIKAVQLAEENDIHLTEFEILTVVAFEYFAENNLDAVVLETGLGGRLDSTNVIEKNICSIITHIDFDHTERLGDTIEKIAYEKAGIIKEGCPIIISEKNLGFETITKIAEEKKAEVITMNNSKIKYLSSFSLAPWGRGQGEGLSQNELALKGTYQKENLALVLGAIEVLKKNGFDISQEAIIKGLKKVKHPCRFEYLEKENIIIDGAHNPNGTKALRESLDYYFPNQKIKFIFGCLKNKNYSEMIKNLFTQQDEIYFYHFDNENACSYEELSVACEFNSKPFSEFKRDANVLTVICGSFYMIKELLFKMGIK